MKNGDYRNQPPTIFCHHCGKKTNPAKCTYLPTGNLRFCSKKCKKVYKKSEKTYLHVELIPFPTKVARRQGIIVTASRGWIQDDPDATYTFKNGELTLRTYPCAHCRKPMTAQTQPRIYQDYDCQGFCSLSCLKKAQNPLAQLRRCLPHNSPYNRPHTKPRKRLTETLFREILNTPPHLKDVEEKKDLTATTTQWSTK
jgi:hypothetical protein